MVWCTETVLDSWPLTHVTFDLCDLWLMWPLTCGLWFVWLLTCDLWLMWPYTTGAHWHISQLMGVFVYTCVCMLHRCDCGCRVSRCVESWLFGMRGPRLCGLAWSTAVWTCRLLLSIVRCVRMLVGMVHMKPFFDSALVAFPLVQRILSNIRPTSKSLTFLSHAQTAISHVCVRACVCACACMCAC